MLSSAEAIMVVSNIATHSAAVISYLLQILFSVVFFYLLVPDTSVDAFASNQELPIYTVFQKKHPLILLAIN